MDVIKYRYNKFFGEWQLVAQQCIVYLRVKKMANSIGDSAGLLWKYLDKNGASSVNKITKETKLDAKSVQRAIGWLAKEGKLSFETMGRTETISLK